MEGKINDADMLVMTRAMESALKRLLSALVRASGESIPVPLEMTADVYGSMSEWVRSAEHLGDVLTRIADARDASRQDGKGAP